MDTVLPKWRPDVDPAAYAPSGIHHLTPEGMDSSMPVCGICVYC